MALPEPPAATPGAPSVVALPAMLDAQAVKQFEQVKRFAQRGRAVTLDVLPVKDADAIGADLMLRVLAAFIKGGFEMSVVGVESLLTVLARTTETGRRDPSEACWMLQIELLRLLGREAAFEDMAIDYCVTYEVSPPSWEPMPATIVAVASGSMRASAWAAGPSVLAGDDAVELIGNLEGRIQDVLLALREHAADRREVVLQCRRLVRVDFGAAGELLNEIVALKAAGKYLRLRDVNHLVAALLSVMGIPELADVRLRRL
jgi:anti-anti-sigma regulatory factor